MQNTIVQYSYYKSPIGDLLLAGANDVLQLLGFPQGKLSHSIDPSWQLDENSFAIHKKQLDEYFAGKRKSFDAPYALTGTAFQQDVLNAVAKIPYGQTNSYGEIAQHIQSPKAVRAVGGANATNPLPIIIPCHRVIGKNGTLTGFGGGMEAKSFLLRLEGAACVTL